MVDPKFIVYPGIKVGQNQNYTVTWDYQTVFVTHREDYDEVMFNSSGLEEYDKDEIEFKLRRYLDEKKKEEEDLTYEN
jgi:hypothetical protein